LLPRLAYIFNVVFHATAGKAAAAAAAAAAAGQRLRTSSCPRQVLQFSGLPTRNRVFLQQPQAALSTFNCSIMAPM